MRPSGKNDDKNNNSGNRVRTSGEILADGSMMELVRSAGGRGGLELLRWDSRKATIAPRIEVAEKIYEPVDLGADVARAVNFPAAPIDYGTTGELLDRISAFLDRYTGLGFEHLRLAAFFVLASWFPEFVPSPVTVLALAQFPSEAPSLLRALRCVCRRGLLVADLSIRGYCALPLTLRPTVIMSQFSVSRSLAGVLRVANTGDIFVENAGVLVDPNCFTVLSGCPDTADPSWSQHMLRISVAPRRANADALDERSVKKVLAELPPRLLAYRMRNFSRVDVSKIDIDFPMLIREIARSLSAVIVDDEPLRAEVTKLLRAQAEDVHTQLIATPEFAIVVAVLASLHQREKKFVPVNVLATAVNAILRSFGEILEFSPAEIGFRLASLGLYTSRTTNAKVLRLNREVSRRVHDLARRLGVPVPDKGFPGCPDCGSPTQAAEKNQLLQGVPRMQR